MVQCLKIAGLTYQISKALKLSENYLPFLLPEDEVNQIHSTISIGKIQVTDKKICHHGLVMDDEKELSIYKVDNDSYYVTLQIKGNDEVFELYASPTWNQIILSEGCTSPCCPPSIIDLIMMLVFIYSAAYYGTILLHASCVKKGEDSLAFIGHSGAGKSTHSRLWLTYVPGTMLLNDDQPAVRVGEDGKVTIYGTPWSGKTPCYINDKGTLKGIIRMKQAPNNKLIPLNPVALFQELLSSCSMIKADPATFKQITSTLAKLASSVSGFVLENRPEEEAVKLIMNKIILQ